MTKLRLLFAIAFVALCVAAQPANAQFGRWTHQIGFDFGPQFPLGLSSTLLKNDSKGYYETWKQATDLQVGIGFTFTYYYRVSKRWFVLLNAGYSRFSLGTVKRPDGQTVQQDGSWANIPILTGIRYNLALAGFQPYLGAEVGMHFNSVSSVAPLQVATLFDTNLGLTPKIGFRYQLARGIDLDASLKYNYLVSSDLPMGYLGANVGISYALDFSSDE